MADTVKFTISLDDNVTPGATRAGAAVERLSRIFGRLDAATHRGGTGALRNIGGALREVGDSGAPGLVARGLGTLASGALAAGAAVGLVAAALAALGARAAVAFGTAAVGAATFRERMSLAFQTLRGGSGAAAFERVKQLARETGAELGDAAEAMRSLAVAQFSQGDAEKLFKRMQDMKALGSTSEQVKRAMLAITQIKGAGKLQGDELNSLAEAGVPLEAVYKALEKRLGKTRTEVLKLKEAGKITAADALAAVDEAIGKITGGAAGSAAAKFAENTLSGAWGKLQSELGMAWDELGKQALPALQSLLPIIKEVTAALTGDTAKDVMAELAAGVSSAANAFAAAWPFVKQFVAAFAEGFGESWQGLKDAIGPVLASLGGGDGKSAAETLKTLGRDLGAAAVAALALVGAAMAVAGAFVTLVTFTTAAMGKAFAVLFSLPAKLSSLASNFMTAGSDLGSNIVNGLVGGVTAGAQRVADAVRGVAAAAVSAAKGALQIKSPSQVFADIGARTTEGFAAGVSGGAPAADGAMRAMVSPSGGVSRAAGGGGGRGGTVGSIVVNVHVAGAGDPSRVAEETARLIPLHLAAALERMALEVA